MPTRDEKLQAVIRAARKRLSQAVTHGVGLGAQSTADVDRLLRAAEDELGVRLDSSDEFPAHPRFRVETS